MEERDRSISYICCKRLNPLFRNVNNLTPMTRGRRGKSKRGTLSKPLNFCLLRIEGHLLAGNRLADACTKISLGGLSKYLSRAGHNHPSISRSGQRYQLPSYSARIQTNRAV